MTLLVNRLVADIGDAGNDIWLINGNNKNTTPVRNATTKEGAVSRIENGNIGVCNGLALLINDSARQMEVGLMDALHENLLSVLFGARSDADGIKANHLLNGFGQVLAFDISGDTEVFQFVIEEIDSVACLLLTELSQRIREGYVIVFTRYSLLCLCTDSQQQGKNENYMSIHGGRLFYGDLIIL